MSDLLGCAVASRGAAGRRESPQLHGMASPNAAASPAQRAFGELSAAAQQWLEEHPGAVKVHLVPMAGAASLAIAEWEARHGAMLPDDLRDFYRTTDGMHLRWSVVGHGREVVPLGCLAVNCLERLVPVSERALRNERDELRPELPGHASSSVRAFELDSTCEAGRVLLLLGVDLGVRRAQVWFQDGSCALSRIALTFTDYFRLLVLHLGVPRWQYAYTEAGLDPTCRQWLRLMAPDRLATPKARANEVGTDQEFGAAMLGSGWGGGSHEPHTQPVRTAWVDSGPPTHAETLLLLSLSSLQQTSAAHSVSRVSSAAGAPRSAIALLSGGSSSIRPCSRASSAASTASTVAAASSSPHAARSGSAAARPASGARSTGGVSLDAGRRRVVSSASRHRQTRAPARANEGPPAEE